MEKNRLEAFSDGVLAITRAPLKQVDGYADRVAERYANKAATKP